MNLFRLALSLLRRDWRVLLLVLAVGRGVVRDRVRRELQTQARSLVSADLALLPCDLSPNQGDTVESARNVGQKRRFDYASF